MTTATPSTSDREYIVERTFDAPRQLVFDAFSKSDHLEHWWGPKDWTLPVCELDFRVGGSWLYCMRSPTGQESWGRSVYREIVPPEKIVHTDSFVDRDGQVLAGMPQMDITLTFEDLGDRTRVVSRTLYATPADLKAVIDMGMEQGIGETLDRLDAYLETAL